MQTVSEIMSRDARFVSPQESLQRAAQMMGELDVGALPVCDGNRLVGMITDRDITIRGTAAGKSPQEAHVEDVMTSDVRWCFEDQPLDEVMIQMADSQIRRIPVVSHDEQKNLVGIVSLGDMATKTADGAPKQDVEQVVEMVSTRSAPSGPAIPVDQIAGTSGEVGAAAAQTGADSAGMAGLDIPAAGESGIGAAGASGRPRDGQGDASVRTGATGDARRNFGVGGGDLTQDGLPPA